MGCRTRLGIVKCSLTSYFSLSLVTLHGLIHLTTLTSPNSWCGILPDLCTEGPSELCPLPREQRDRISQKRISLWGWSKGLSFRFADSTSPGEGCGEKHLARARAAGLESQYQLLKNFCLQNQLFLRENGGFPPISHQEEGCSVITSISEYHCSDLL